MAHIYIKAVEGAGLTCTNRCPHNFTSLMICLPNVSHRPLTDASITTDHFVRDILQGHLQSDFLSFSGYMTSHGGGSDGSDGSCRKSKYCGPTRSDLWFLFSDWPSVLQSAGKVRNIKMSQMV